MDGNNCWIHQVRNKKMEKSADKTGAGREVPVLLFSITPQVRTLYMVTSGKGVVTHAPEGMKGS